jgi:hypothetical protein
MIDEVIGPGLINPRDICYVNAFAQFLFHILHLRLMIVAWPNRDPIISAFRLMFIAMSQNRPINAVSLSTVCEPDILDGKDCFELGLQKLGALRDASSGMLRDTIEQLFCFRQITRFFTAYSSRCVPDQPLFFIDLPVSGSSPLMLSTEKNVRPNRDDSDQVLIMMIRVDFGSERTIRGKYIK